MSEFDKPEGKEPPRERINLEDELKRYLKAEPFHNIEIVTTSGDRYEITSPWQIAIGDAAIVIARGKYGVRIIRKSQVVEISVHEPV